ncbi:hypothetical protein BY458DRAFT_505430 [Sporodiniella umbellata]|nr:hypothetical protein BY458DRAFT_505430 [Sporodiniella umbellata]
MPSEPFPQSLYTLLHTKHLCPFQFKRRLNLDRMIIAGDFNYSIQRINKLRAATDGQWLEMLQLQSYNSMQFSDLEDIPTFQRTKEGTTIQSTIDYIYVSQDTQC